MRTAGNYQITFKMGVKDKVIPFILIKIILHLNMLILSITTHQIINLELEMCAS